MTINEISSTGAANSVYENQTVKADQTTKAPPVNQDTQKSVHILDTDTIKHIVMLYDRKGKVHIKFMDYHNNVIYQVPSEMVVKMEEFDKPVKSSVFQR